MILLNGNGLVHWIFRRICWKIIYIYSSVINTTVLTDNISYNLINVMFNVDVYVEYLPTSIRLMQTTTSIAVQAIAPSLAHHDYYEV